MACVELVCPDDGQVYCWGWHLIMRDDDWRDVVSQPEQVAECVERVAFMAATYGVDLGRATWTGRMSP